jgi:CRISPR/Cas system-associated exonuclease Cas4 (RecB family)
MTLYKLSPSQLTFAWDECPRCFYLDVVLGIKRPATAFPKVFSRIDSLMKHLYADKPTSALSPELPPGRVTLQGKWVNSAPIQFDGIEASCYLKGAFDSVLAFEDGTYAVIDFKTSSPSPAHVGFYGRQLSAYAYALEHPGEKGLSLSPISKLGLLYLDPVDIEHGADHKRIIYGGEVTWQELPKDEKAFLDFMKEVLTLLSLPEPPSAPDTCGFCAYRAEACQHGF